METLTRANGSIVFGQYLRLCRPGHLAYFRLDSGKVVLVDETNMIVRRAKPAARKFR